MSRFCIKTVSLSLKTRQKLEWLIQKDYLPSRSEFIRSAVMSLVEMIHRVNWEFRYDYLREPKNLSYQINYTILHQIEVLVKRVEIKTVSAFIRIAIFHEFKRWERIYKIDLDEMIQ